MLGRWHAMDFTRGGVMEQARLEVVSRLGQLQIDSVNVCVRAHYMPLFARLGPYDRGLLDRAASLLIDAWEAVKV